MANPEALTKVRNRGNRCRASQGENKPARAWKHYMEVLNEAKVGSATIKDMTPAMTQRTKRAIVSFTAE
jgi:hypothetical protein